MNKILDYLFPNYSCFVCGREINVSDVKNICNDCAGKLRCNEGVKTGVNYNAGFAPFLYGFEKGCGIARLIMDLKYGANSMAALPLATYMNKSLPPNIKYDFMVPVPLSKRRMRQRGYNQAELLAKEISTMNEVEIRIDLIERIRATKPQKNMTHEQRRQNQKDAYKVTDTKAIKGKTILIVDDVMTSGATVEEIAKMLKKAKAKRVDVLTVATVTRG